ncbi:MAG: hypothetical protein E3J71_04515 [Candidatus Stahlbacteria bacterium]|nr:MAG: hypothetical protein E3J71_04515 [Candidatus Stahlbacteria bacterium]
MTTFGLLTLLVSAFGSDTVIVYSSGYNNMLQRGVWNSVYFERKLGKELSLTLNEWYSISWDSLSKDLRRSAYNTVGVIYNPAQWLAIKSGLTGSRSLTEEADGSQGYTRYSSEGFIRTTTSTDLLYSDYELRYGKERSAISGPEAGWSIDEIKKDAATIKIRTDPCTLSIYHHLDRHTTWSDGGDTLQVTLARIPFLKGYLLSGTEFGRRRTKGYSDYEGLGAKFWVKDTLRITPHVGLSIGASYMLDTLTNNLWKDLTYSEEERNLSARVSYAPFKRTNLQIELRNEQNFHDQVDDYYDEESFKHSFTGSISHNFYRRPAQARNIWGMAVNFISPGSILFSHSLSLERIFTPDSANALDRDNFKERLSLSATLRPGENLSTYFTLSHYIQRTHYTDTINTSYAGSSNERRSSNATWNLNLEVPRYLAISNSANLYFDWTRYYNDSTLNRADRTWKEQISVSVFPQAALEPGVNLGWERYENWRVISGALVRRGLKDVFEQRYSISFVQKRKEEAPRWWSQPYWEREWLRITGFAGIRMEITPAEPQGLWQESRFAGIEISACPWPYLSLNGRIKFTRSNYEVPFEASCFLSSSF